MKKEFRIAHISDLHFGPSHNGNAAGQLVHDLSVEIKPEVIIVSGDLTDWGKNAELQQAHNFLMELADKCKINGSRIVVIPGNHDVNNIRGRLYPKSKLLNYTSKNFPLFSMEPAHFNRYFDELNVAVFCFDSTLTNINIAEGYIDEHHYLTFVQEYERIINNQNRDCFKIAVVHHHPLPIPHTSGDHFLMFRKAGDFIQMMMRREIDLVLYGHKHEAFFSKVRFRLDRRDLEIACAGAGTATQKLEEYKIH